MSELRRPVICHLLHTLNVGGAEVLAARLGRQMRDEWSIHFLCLDEIGTLGEQLKGEGFPVEVLKRREGVDWRCAWRLARYLRRHHVDLVHAHQYTPFFYGLMARLMRRRPAILFTEHGRHFPDFPRPKRKVVNRLLLRKRDRVVGVGEAVKQALIVNEGFRPERVDVIYNGIDTSRFTASEIDRAICRRELGFGADTFLLLQVARLDYLKDHATAVRVIQRVATERADSVLLLVGEGPEHDAIQRLLTAQYLNERVRFLGLRQDIPRLINAADAFLLTSISEGIPLTILEAMAAGVPVVATRVGGVSEIVVENETGFLAPAGDDAALAAHVLRLAGDPALRQRLGQNGRERVCAKFAESQMHAHYLALYRSML